MEVDIKNKRPLPPLTTAWQCQLLESFAAAAAAASVYNFHSLIQLVLQG